MWGGCEYMWEGEGDVGRGRGVAMATALDSAVGDIVDALNRTGVLGDTLIFFASGG